MSRHGHSAGGHLAEMLAATNNNPKMEDLSMGNPMTSSAVHGVVAWYGVADITSLARLGALSGDKLMGYAIKGNEEKAKVASPIEYVNKDFPPILLVHGTNDQVVPFTQSITMAKKVNAVTGKEQAKVKLFINGSHGDAVIKTVENVADNLHFVDGILVPAIQSRIINEHIKEAVRHLQLHREFKIDKVKIKSCSHLIIEVGPFEPYKNWFLLIVLLFSCKIVSEIQTCNNIRPHIIEPVALIF
jgi:acetyl esterase/lipase